MKAAGEQCKKTKCSNLPLNHLFMSVAIETTGMFGPETVLFLEDLSNRLWQVTGGEDTCHHLLQRLSVGVQRGIQHQCWVVLKGSAFQAFMDIRTLFCLASCIIQMRVYNIYNF